MDPSDDEYLTAKEAAALLKVSVSTIYVYVTRKGIRSRQVAGSREHRYWKPDLERLLSKGDSSNAPRRGDLQRESAITLLTERGPFYRGQSALDLAAGASFEEVAALLWSCAPEQAFTDEVPAAPDGFAPYQGRRRDAGGVEIATSVFPSLESANLRAYDLSPLGMARSGADVLRWLAAILLKQDRPSAAPLSEFVADVLELDDGRRRMVRQALILAADHGFEPGTYAVRAVAATGVTPWRSVMTGMLVATGRRSGFGRLDAIRRFLAEILDGPDARTPIVRRLREGEAIPGFGSTLYKGGDPRARMLLATCEACLDDDPSFRRLAGVVELVQETRGLAPDHALVSMFIDRCVGVGFGNSLFLLGRSAGWIAHAIEQYAIGEAEHREGVYRGPLPE